MGIKHLEKAQLLFRNNPNKDFSMSEVRGEIEANHKMTNEVIEHLIKVETIKKVQAKGKLRYRWNQ